MQDTKEKKPDIPGLSDRKLMILLVEDSQTDAYTTQRVLKEHMRHPCAVQHVECIKDARKVLKHSSGFDVVLLDLGLPDTNGGHDTFQHIKELEPDLPVIVLTSVNDHDMAVEMIGDGAEDYVRKSLISMEPNILCDTIDFAVSRYRCTKNALAQKEDIIEEKDKVLSWMSGGYTK